MRRDEYLKDVGEQIRWKRARVPLLTELDDHITDCRDDYLARGMSEEEAEEKAVAQMGDPIETGTMLDRVHRPRPDWGVICSFSALLILGTALMYLTFGAESGKEMLLLASGSIAALTAGYFFDYTNLARFPKILFFSVWGICSIGQIFVSSGSGRILLSQIEYALPLAYGVLLWSLCGVRSQTKKLLFAYIGGAMCIFAAIFSNVGFNAVMYNYVCCCGIIAYAAAQGIFTRNRRKNIIICVFPLLLAAGFAVLLLLTLYPGMIGRIESVFNPYSNAYEKGYQSVLIRELVYNSRFIGKGGTGNYDFISYVEQYERQNLFKNDFLLAFSAHYLGWITISAVFLITAGLCLFIIRGIRRQSCILGKLTAFSVAICFAVRAVMYFACNLGFELFTMDGLMLFSYNGKLMLLDAFMAGIMLSVFRTESISRDSVIQNRAKKAT